MNWLCKFGIHKWTKWSEANTMTWVNPKTQKTTGIMSQKRTCEKCGKYQVRKV